MNHAPLSWEGFITMSPEGRRFAAACATATDSFRRLGEALERWREQALEEDPGLAEAVRFEREYGDPDAGWLDVAAKRELAP